MNIFAADDILNFFSSWSDILCDSSAGRLFIQNGKPYIPPKSKRLSHFLLSVNAVIGILRFILCQMAYELDLNLFCLFLCFTSQSTIFQSWDDFLSSWVEPVLSKGIKCIPQGHNTVTLPVVSFKLATLQSPVQCSSK